MTTVDHFIEILRPKLGYETHLGAWLTIDQERIDRFAAATGDNQWIHTDPQRAASESPYGATVAHGFLTLSLLPFLMEIIHPDYLQKVYPGMQMVVNYGLNKVRFPSPVVVGSRVRTRTVLHSVEKVGDALQIIQVVTVDIEGKDKPACVAEIIMRVC